MLFQANSFPKNVKFSLTVMSQRVQRNESAVNLTIVQLWLISSRIQFLRLIWSFLA